MLSWPSPKSTKENRVAVQYNQKEEMVITVQQLSVTQIQRNLRCTRGIPTTLKQFLSLNINWLTSGDRETCDEKFNLQKTESLWPHENNTGSTRIEQVEHQKEFSLWIQHENKRERWILPKGVSNSPCVREISRLVSAS